MVWAHSADQCAAMLCHLLPGALSPYLSDPQLEVVAKHKLDNLSSGKLKPDIARSYVQGVGALSKNVGYRFGKYLPMAVPVVMQHGQKAAEGDDEVREFALQVCVVVVVCGMIDAALGSCMVLVDNCCCWSQRMLGFCRTASGMVGCMSIRHTSVTKMIIYHACHLL